MTSPVVELTSVSKNYGALRPLRIARLAIAQGEQVAIIGPDQPAAEVLINLVTGASLPDTGEVRVFGRSTAEITDANDWLAALDRFGIVSERAALLESMTVIQNLAVPFSLEIEPPPAAIFEQAAALAAELRLAEPARQKRAADLDGALRLRLRVARALALNPALLLLEHPSGFVARQDVSDVGRDIRLTLERRGSSALTITADAEFAHAVADHILILDAASGRLKKR